MIVLREKDVFLNYKNKIYARKAIEFLEKRDLIPLKSSSSLSSLVGYLIGDGNLGKDKFVGDFRFYGSEEKLEGIRLKVFELFSVKPKRFDKRKGGFFLKYNNAIIARVLDIVGVPRGNKVISSFR